MFVGAIFVLMRMSVAEGTRRQHILCLKIRICLKISQKTILFRSVNSGSSIIKR